MQFLKFKGINGTILGLTVTQISVPHGQVSVHGTENFTASGKLLLSAEPHNWPG